MAAYMFGLYHGRLAEYGAVNRQAHAATMKNTASPIKAIAARDVYYPGTEDLAPNEMRVVALGTGMPTIRPKQAAACFLVELGNGDKFHEDPHGLSG